MAKNKQVALRKIRDDVIDKFFREQWKDVWFYPDRKGVMGYLGTQDIMFVGLNPSYGEFPSDDDVFYYNELKNNEFGNAHLTDLIKLRATTKKVNELLKNEKILSEQIGILEREIRETEPVLIVAIHGTVRAELRKRLKGQSDRIRYIPHYSRRFGKSGKLRGEFKNKLLKIKKEYVNLKHTLA